MRLHQGAGCLYLFPLRRIDLGFDWDENRNTEQSWREWRFNSQAQESFSHDPEVQVSTATAQGARRDPHQLRYSQSQNRPPHQVWAASLLRRNILERLLSVAMLEQSQD